MLGQVDEILDPIATIFSTGNTSSAASIFGEHYVDHQRPPELGVLEGPEEFVMIVEGARAALPGLQVAVLGSTLIDDLLIGLFSWTSKALDLQRLTVEVLRLQDAEVVEHWGMEL